MIKPVSSNTHLSRSFLTYHLFDLELFFLCHGRHKKNEMVKFESGHKFSSITITSYYSVFLMVWCRCQIVPDKVTLTHHKVKGHQKNLDWNKMKKSNLAEVILTMGLRFLMRYWWEFCIPPSFHWGTFYIAMVINMLCIYAIKM